MMSGRLRKFKSRSAQSVLSYVGESLGDIGSPVYTIDKSNHVAIFRFNTALQLAEVRRDILRYTRLSGVISIHSSEDPSYVDGELANRRYVLKVSWTPGLLTPRVEGLLRTLITKYKMIPEGTQTFME